ncbi:MAG: hypothetical protein ABW360_06800 [Phenylobacterium sp.]
MRPTLFQGIAAASLAGLLTGGAMHPDLRVGEGPAGPQMLMGAPVVRSYAWNEVQPTSWNGEVPEWVIGTDYTRPPTYPELALVDGETAFDHNLYQEPTAAEPPPSPLATWNFLDDERRPAANPSEGGDILAGLASAPAPADPPADEAGGEPA